MIRTGDPVCRICRRPLTDLASRYRLVGPDCWARLTAAEQAKALALAAAERDPARIPEARPPSARALLNNANARRAARAGEGQLCHHENVAGRCGDCRREADPWRAAERIAREVCAEAQEQRRAARARILAARYAHATPWTAPERLRPARTRATRTAKRTTSPTSLTGQLELL